MKTLSACAAILLFAVAQTNADEATDILQATGIKGGLIVHLGCGDGKLTAALHANDSFIVHGLDANVTAARKLIQSLGSYGPVSVEPWAGGPLPYADNLVNLVVAEKLSGVSMDEVMRVLAPNGVALIAGQKIVKPWPKEIDEWTHYLHGPDNNAVAHDSVVGPPASVQWVEGPLWQRHHEMNANPNAMVSAQGRIFYINDEATATISGLPDKWALIARDAFNGTLLWKRAVPDWGWKAWSSIETGGRFNLPIHTARRLVAVGDRIYVTLGFNAPLTALDAATGKIVKTYDGTQFTDEILLTDGLLVLTVNDAPQQPDAVGERPQRRKKAKTAAAPVDYGPGVKKRVMVLRADTGEILWAKEGFSGVSSSPIAGHILRVTRLLTAADSSKVVCVEKDALIALDLKTGRELWRTQRPSLAPNPPTLRENLLNFSSIVLHQDIVLFLQTDESYDLAEGAGQRGVRCKLLGLSAETGKVLWIRPCSKWGPASEGDVFVIGDLVWTHAPDQKPNDFAIVGLDLHSGEIKRSISTEKVLDEAHHHRCFRNKATENYLLTGRRGIETIDVQQGQITKNEWTRGACRYGIMPCNGLIYVPPHPCQCYIDVKLTGFYALGAAHKDVERGRLGLERLEHGPAFETTNLQSQITNSDWPTYRHDTHRSGATTADLPAQLTRLWEAKLGSRPSACTVGGGRVFVAAVEQHRVVALDAKDGRELWNYTAGGRVDTPPTIDNDHVLFGSADGWVYCLRASDGVLAWRFRAAPEERRIMAHGQLESAWPVHGTVLVNDGVAYVAAGRSTHLDGGIRVFALKSQTGEFIRELKTLNEKPEGLDDVLVADSNRVYMRHLEFSLKPGENTAAGPRAYSTAGLLDDSCFARVGWTTKSNIGNNGKAKGEKPADLLVFDGTSTFAFQSRRQGGFGGWFQAASGAYQMSATDRQGNLHWNVKLPVRVRALTAAGRTLFAAGSRDVASPPDPWAAIDGRAGGVLWVLATANGSKLTELALDAAPVWDGLAVGDNKVFLSTLDGKVICLTATQKER